MEKIHVKHEKFFKNKWYMLIYMLIFMFLIYICYKIGTYDYKNVIPDQDKFSSEFTMVDNDNIFEYATATDVYMIANGKKGIVFFGNPNNSWSQYYAKILDDTAKEAGIKKIYYYDFYEDRNQNNATYETIVNLLSNYVTYNDLGEAEIYAPSLLVVSNDEVLYFDNETTFINGSTTPDLYWTEYNKGIKENTLKTVFNKYLEG